MVRARLLTNRSPGRPLEDNVFINPEDGTPATFMARNAPSPGG